MPGSPLAITICPLDNQKFDENIKFIAHVRKKHREVLMVKIGRKKSKFNLKSLDMLDFMKDGESYAPMHFYVKFSPSYVTNYLRYFLSKKFIDRYQEVNSSSVTYSINQRGRDYLERTRKQEKIERTWNRLKGLTDDELSIIGECLENWPMDDLGLGKRTSALRMEFAGELKRRLVPTRKTKR